MKKITFLFSLFLVHFLVVGCATNRGVVNLQLEGSTVSQATNGKSIFVQSVSDARVFEEAPRSADIPSLGFGGATAASNEIKKRAIARKRNGFGKALGDILLDEGQTVEKVVKDTVCRSFKELGYEVIDDPAKVDKDTIIAKVTIDKFWSWMNPGFWAITLNSEISTKIELKDSSKQIDETIYAKVDGKYQVAGTGNWLEIMQKGLTEYSGKLKAEFSGLAGL
ncbi:MAG: hypothetical protein OEY01_07875 [Desulfobulbaceae bacterium]|nr:hypothetical protein [Desulfobulbaceae bacterium]HIJ78974.1 flagellar biosynthesis protein [Deltaproteobacteria bacterium]